MSNVHKQRVKSLKRFHQGADIGWGLVKSCSDGMRVVILSGRSSLCKGRLRKGLVEGTRQMALRPWR